MNNNEFIERVVIQFAMHCDENGLSHQDGADLAYDLGLELDFTAEDREEGP